MTSGAMTGARRMLLALLRASMLLGALLLASTGTATAGASADTATEWQRLTPMQREALAPLKDEWSRFSADRRRKWLNIASRYPAMNPQQRQVLQRRMVEWVHMSPGQRRLARENYLATGRAPLQSRRQAWERYQKLSAQQRRELERQAHKPPHHVHVVRYGTAAHTPARPTPAGSRPAAPGVRAHAASSAARPAARPASSPRAAAAVHAASAAAAPAATAQRSASTPQAAGTASAAQPAPAQHAAAQPSASAAQR